MMPFRAARLTNTEIEMNQDSVQKARELLIRWKENDQNDHDPTVNHNLIRNLCQALGVKI